MGTLCPCLAIYSRIEEVSDVTADFYCRNSLYLSCIIVMTSLLPDWRPQTHRISFTRVGGRDTHHHGQAWRICWHWLWWDHRGNLPRQWWNQVSQGNITNYKPSPLSRVTRSALTCSTPRSRTSSQPTIWARSWEPWASDPPRRNSRSCWWRSMRTAREKSSSESFVNCAPHS